MSILIGLGLWSQVFTRRSDTRAVGTADLGGMQIISGQPAMTPVRPRLIGAQPVAGGPEPLPVVVAGVPGDPERDSRVLLTTILARVQARQAATVLLDLACEEFLSLLVEVENGGLLADTAWLTKGPEYRTRRMPRFQVERRPRSRVAAQFLLACGINLSALFALAVPLSDAGGVTLDRVLCCLQEGMPVRQIRPMLRTRRWPQAATQD